MLEVHRGDEAFRTLPAGLVLSRKHRAIPVRGGVGNTQCQAFVRLRSLKNSRLTMLNHKMLPIFESNWFKCPEEHPIPRRHNLLLKMVREGLARGYRSCGSKVV
ncbi:MAG: hypothetical protein BWY17_01854 [Deltaproteobacteria bacterium ADurb.Bin207]|nr:MAG: hypothetical protein BWY17_01854 [Deltaproteobacteria bacterium ADurb.Bin207]